MSKCFRMFVLVPFVYATHENSNIGIHRNGHQFCLLKNLKATRKKEFTRKNHESRRNPISTIFISPDFILGTSTCSENPPELPRSPFAWKTQPTHSVFRKIVIHLMLVIVVVVMIILDQGRLDKSFVVIVKVLHRVFRHDHH